MNSGSTPLNREASRCVGLPSFHDFIGDSPPMKQLFRFLSLVGPSTAPILLVGESGTGKELAARTLHRLSGRAGSFVAINCAAIHDTLVEAELFGHEKGAFTGATGRQPGCFELADQGTLFLDELAAMPLATQAKLLRALEEKSFRRLRGTAEVHVDVRIVVATNDDLVNAVREGRLRDDLLYRINVFTITMPTLRERRSDVPHLARYFIEHFARLNRKGRMTLEPAAVKHLIRYEWPGNVRELRNAMERAVILTTDGVIRIHHLPPTVVESAPSDLEETPETKEDDSADQPPFQVGMSLEEATRSLMMRTLESTNFNKTRTAKILGVSARTVYNKLREWSQGGDSEVKPSGENAISSPAPDRSEKRAPRLVSIEDARHRRLG